MTHFLRALLLSSLIIPLTGLTAHGQNVGIGTTNPSEKLDVDGNLRLRTTTGTLLRTDGTGVVQSTGLGSALDFSGGQLSIADGGGSGEVLQWNGTKWVPAPDANTTYSAGTGINLSGTTIENTGDLSNTNEYQDLGRTGNTITINNGSNVDLSPILSDNQDLSKSVSGNTVDIQIDNGSNISLTKDDNDWTRDAGNGYLYPSTIGDQVGVGTTNPTTIPNTNMELHDGSFASIGLISSGVQGLLTASNTNDRVIMGSSSNHPLQFSTDGNPIAAFDVNGNLGIGDLDPGYRLTVATNNQPTITVGHTGANQASSGRLIFSEEADDYDNSNYVGFAFSYDGNQEELYLDAADAGTPDRVITYDRASQNVTFAQDVEVDGLDGGGQQNVLVNNDGDLITGAPATDGDWTVDNGDNETYLTDANHNVGIGTSSPDNTLHLKDNEGYGPFIRLDRTANSNFDDVAIQGVHSGGGTANNYFYIGPSENDRDYFNISLEGDGNVGIGTNNVDSKLEVAGNARLDQNFMVFEGNDNDEYYIGGGSTPDAGPSGIHVEAQYNPPNGDPIFVVESSGGSERLRVEHAGYTSTSNNLAVDGTGDSYIQGQVGIGTTTPAERLEINGDVKNTSGDFFITAEEDMRLRFNNDDDNYDFFLENEAQGTNAMIVSGLSNDATFTSSVTVDDQLGVGTASPFAKLHVTNGPGTPPTTTSTVTENYTFVMDNFASGGDQNTLTFNLPDNIEDAYLSVDVTGDMGLNSEYANVEIDGTQIGGNLSDGEDDCDYDNGENAVNVADVTANLQGNNSVTLRGISSATTDQGTFACSGTAVRIRWTFTITYVDQVPSNEIALFEGSVRADGYLYNSDRRLKKNITELKTVMSKLHQIEGVAFNWKDKARRQRSTHDRQIGLIAQEVQQQFPELVAYDAEGNLTVDYPRMTPILLQALKEQDRKIRQLQQRNNELKAEVQQGQQARQKMRQRLNRLERIVGQQAQR